VSTSRAESSKPRAKSRKPGADSLHREPEALKPL
jgi:hypothetical protein